MGVERKDKALRRYQPLIENRSYRIGFLS